MTNEKWCPFPKQEKVLSISADTCFEILFGGARGPGKAQPLNSLISTPKGFVQMGNVKVGDIISSPLGGSQKVTGVFLQGIKRIHEITFIDGAKCEVSEDHLWLSSISNRHTEYKVYKTSELIKILETGKNLECRPYPLIPLSKPINYISMGKLILDPYLLGLLLGDGCFKSSNICFTTKDKELLSIFNKNGYKPSRHKNSEIDYTITYPREKNGSDGRFKASNKSLSVLIKKLHLHNLGSHNKFIPDIYKFSSINDRWSLIQGLMDTDGSVDKDGYCEYATVSKQLAIDVRDIIWSLGGKAALNERFTKCNGKSFKSYRLYINTKKNSKLFRLKRKKRRCVDIFNGGVSRLKRRMVSIKYIGKKECQCISVEDTLYLTNDYIVTHNTDCGIQWLHGEKIGEFADGSPKYYIHHPQYRALILRKDYSDLVDWIDRAKFLYRYANVKVVGNPAVMIWESGATFRLGHLKNKTSYEKYLGHSYHRLLIEETTLIPQEKFYTQILGSVRSTVPELKTQVLNTTNPGNVGHHWVYNRFVKPAPYNNIFKGEDERTRIYVPATIDDNPILMKDKNYMMYLEGLKFTDPNLYKAWRNGDWNVFEGQFFGEFDTYLHVVPNFIPSNGLTLVGGSDWGYSPRPFVLLLGAIQKVPWKGSYFNRLWIYDEIRYTKKNPQELAVIIKEREENIDKFDMLKLDPSASTKAKDGSLSIQDQFINEGINFSPANNNRPNGWMAVRKWLSMAPDGIPYMLFTERCNFLIKNLPMLVYDDLRKDDLDTLGPDDEGDALRYLCVHTKWIDASAQGVDRESSPVVLSHKQLLKDKELFDNDPGEDNYKTVI
jgi:hypothetical protein